MATPLVDELYVLLRGRLNALKRMGLLRASAKTERAWWHAASVDCWWMMGGAPTVRAGCASTERLRFHDGAEALVLLHALLLTDVRACMEYIGHVWSHTTCAACGAVRSFGTTSRRRVLGYAYHITSSDDLGPISERVLGIEAPSDRFVTEFGAIKNKLSPVARGLWQRPIPVRLHINATSPHVAELARLLRQVLHAAMAQLMHRQTTAHGDIAQAAAAFTRFEIVEICLEKASRPLVNVESLECLARLTQLGIRVRYLPTIARQDLSEADRVAVIRSLQALMPPRCAAVEDAAANARTSTFSSHGVRSRLLSRTAATAEPPITQIGPEFVHATGDMATTLIPALFSAIQVSCTVKHVELEVRFAPFELTDTKKRIRAISLWKWTAYALFSRHADHDVKKVTLHIGHFDHEMLSAVEAVLCAENPLDVLYNTTVTNDCHVVASRFHWHRPEVWSLSDSASNDIRLYRSSEPQAVRVIDKSERLGSSWWRVLLPGCGEAWVAATDATEVDQHAAVKEIVPRRSSRLVELRLEGICASTSTDVLTFLRLVAHDLCSVHLETDANVFEEFDMTEWMLELLRMGSNLERLYVPWNAQIRRLRHIVEAAEAGYCRLRTLSLRQAFDSDTSDLLEFLDVLCDSGHPLTRRLEEFHVGVEIPATSTRDFSATWQRLLQLNRTLHTIVIWLFASKTIDTTVEKIAIRTGPLGLPSKLSFLHAIQDPTRVGGVGSRLDTSVLAVIFAFAAQHRERKIRVVLKR